MKRVIMSLLVAMVIISFSACAPVNAAGVEQTGEGKTVGIANFHLVNDWCTYSSGEATDYLEARGYTVINTNAQGNTSQHVRDVENLMERGVEGIIIAGGEGRAHRELSIQAKNAGIKVIGMEMYLPGASSGVACDNYTGGVQIAQFMVNRMGGEGKYFVLDSPGWQTLEIRKRMLEAVFVDFPDIVSVGEYEIVGDPITSGYDTTRAVIRSHPDLKGVVSTWGLPGIGAAMAIQELGLENQIVVVSADSDRPVLSKMAEEDSPYMAYIGQDPRRNGEYAAALVDRAITHGDEDMPRMVFAPTLMVSNHDTHLDFPDIVRMNMRDLWDRVYIGEERDFD